MTIPLVAAILTPAAALGCETIFANEKACAALLRSASLFLKNGIAKAANNARDRRVRRTCRSSALESLCHARAAAAMADWSSHFPPSWSDAECDALTDKESPRRGPLRRKSQEPSLSELKQQHATIDSHMSDATVGAPPGSRMLMLPTLQLECGRTLREVPVAFASYGTLNADASNCVVVGHSLTSNANVHEWWGELLGEDAGFALDTTELFVLCVNLLASPYGTCSPLSTDPDAPYVRPYGGHFPLCTMRDNCALHAAVMNELGVAKARAFVGGSMGAMLALQFAALYPQRVEALVAIAGCGRQPAWAIAAGECQRHCIYADEEWKGGHYAEGSGAPVRGLYAARMQAMLTYRTPQSISARFRRQRQPGGLDAQRKQHEGCGGAVGGGSPKAAKESTVFAPMPSRTQPDDAPFSAKRIGTPALASDHFAASSYLRHQGDKFVRRFDANCYVHLTLTLDSFDVGGIGGGGGGGGEEEAAEGSSYEETLRGLQMPTFVLGVNSDALYPYECSAELAELIPNSTLHELDSPHGHDAFLISLADVNLAMLSWDFGQGPEVVALDCDLGL